MASCSCAKVTEQSRLKLQVLPSDVLTLILFSNGLEAGPDGLEAGPDGLGVGLRADEGGVLELGKVLEVGVVLEVE